VPKPLSLRAWKARRPTAKDHQIEAAWLKEHWTYGGRIHEETAKAIVSALNEPSTRAEGHPLYFKLFAEYANALEVAGAIGWAIRTRRTHRMLVLDAVLTYPPEAPGAFYGAARRNRSGSLMRLLDLPAENRVVAALAASAPAWSEEECRDSLPAAVQQAKFLADRYFAEEEIIRKTYNRAKHGATMLHYPPLTELQFYVIGPHVDVTGPRDKARYDLPKFTVNRQMIASLETGVAAAGSMIRYLSGLAKALNDAALLYPRRRSAQ